MASQCGFTPQYADLEALYRKHRAEGFAVLGFPMRSVRPSRAGRRDRDQTILRTQIPGHISDVRQDQGQWTAASALEFLEVVPPGHLVHKAIKWNFTKFSDRREGSVIGRYAPTVGSERIEKDVLPLLAEHAV